MDNNLGNTIFMGIVEDVTDPLRVGRIKVRVQGVYDGIKKEDIPYAYPWRDLAGKQFSVTAVGKMVYVIFPMCNIKEPVYLYSECYNVNLQRKLQSMGDDEYKNFVSLLLDNRTQIFADDVELVLDYYITSIRIKKSGINLILKNNDQLINLGSEDANQSAVLGDNFMSWLDEFIQTLLLPTSLVGNSGAPILKPQIDALCTKYQALRPTKFLSNNVKIVDNQMVKVVTDRNIVTNSATQDRDVKVNSVPPFDPSSISNMPPTVVNDKDEVNKDQEKLKDTVVDNNTKEMEKKEISDKTEDPNVKELPNSNIFVSDEPVFNSITGKTTDQIIQGEDLPIDESMFEEVKDSNYGDYTGGGDDSIFEQENENNYDTASLTQKKVDTNGTTIYNNSSYQNVTPPPPVYVDSVILNKQKYTVGQNINQINKTIVGNGDDKKSYIVTTDSKGIIKTITVNPNGGEIVEKMVNFAKQWAYQGEGTGIKEIGGDNVSFSDTTFQNLMEKAGWKSTNQWCVFFCRMVWMNTLPSTHWNVAQNLIYGSSLEGWSKCQNSANLKGLFVASSSPQVGGIVMYKRMINNMPALYQGYPGGHGGFVTGVNMNGNSIISFNTIEGNTSGQGLSKSVKEEFDGGGCFAKTNKPFAWNAGSGNKEELRLLGFINPVF